MPRPRWRSGVLQVKSTIRMEKLYAKRAKELNELLTYADYKIRLQRWLQQCSNKPSTMPRPRWRSGVLQVKSTIRMEKLYANRAKELNDLLTYADYKIRLQRWLQQCSNKPRCRRGAIRG